MRRKKITIKRENASVLRPKKLKAFNLREFLALSKKLKNSAEDEDKKYGKINTNSGLVI